MINHISLNGVLLDYQNDSLIRYIEVTRQYKNNQGTYDKDIFPLMYWTKDNHSSLFSYKSGTLVSVDGHLENIDGQIYIIVESLMYICSEKISFNKFNQ